MLEQLDKLLKKKNLSLSKDIIIIIKEKLKHFDDQITIKADGLKTKEKYEEIMERKLFEYAGFGNLKQFVEIV